MNLKKFLTSKKYGSLQYKLSYFFHSKIPFISKGWNDYHNPWYIWWKCRKHFKKPKWRRVNCGKLVWFFGLPCRNDYYNKILDISFSALGWKDKYNSPRHEYDPYINIVLFRKWQICWVFTYWNKNDPNSSTRNLATWEAMLDFLYYKKTIDTVKNSHQWGTGVNKEGVITINENTK